MARCAMRTRRFGRFLDQRQRAAHAVFIGTLVSQFIEGSLVDSGR